MNGQQITLPPESSAGLYVAFEPKLERVGRGARITMCKRCGRLVGHWPLDSVGHEIICLKCADDVPQIRRHIDELAKARGD
jgi:hypothetical protein